MSLFREFYVIYPVPQFRKFKEKRSKNRNQKKVRITCADYVHNTIAAGLARERYIAAGLARVTKGTIRVAETVTVIEETDKIFKKLVN